jgi:hypothetical protein
MYRRRDKNQVSMLEDNKRFIVEINENNRWVQMSKLMPWERIEEHYIKSMCEDKGRKSIPSRIAFGAIYAKEELNLTDEETVAQIGENAYLQYFLGLQEFESKPLFDSSMMVHFRKRFTAAFITEVNEYVCTGKWPHTECASQGDDSDDSSDPPKESGTGTPPGEEKSKNKGTLMLDATVAPSDIRYPNDVLLLDECRENLEGFIDIVWDHSEKKGHKTPYSRRAAHKKTINFIKKKRKSKRMINTALNTQLNYVDLAAQQLVALLMLCGADLLTEREWDRFDLICQVYLQQKWMFENKTNRCEDKILNLRQPHVRAIIRNKARTKYEYGQKLALSRIDGYVFLEKQSWDNFNEGNTLQQSVMNYYKRFGYFPKAVLADQIYRTKDNIAFCKSKGIRLSGPKLGRKTDGQQEREKKQAYKDSCERNAMEGSNGVLKRRYGLDLIMCVLRHNAEVEARLQILAMNLRRRLRLLFAFLWIWISMATLKQKKPILQ